MATEAAAAAPMPITQDLRDELRAATIGNAKAAGGRSEMVDFGGKRFEVRQFTIAQTRKIERASLGRDGKADPYRQLALSIIECVYVPGTPTKVYDARDEDTLLENAVDGYLQAFSEAMSRVNKVQSPEEAEKNSGRTSSGSSSL